MKKRVAGYARTCLKKQSRNLHAPLCGIFQPNSVAVAYYGALIRAKSPTNCNTHLAESFFKQALRFICASGSTGGGVQLVQKIMCERVLGKAFLKSTCPILRYILQNAFSNTLWSADISNGMKYVINVGYFICLNFYMHFFENKFLKSLTFTHMVLNQLTV